MKLLPLRTAAPPVPKVPAALVGLRPATKVSVWAAVAGLGLRPTMPKSFVEDTVPCLRRPTPGVMVPLAVLPAVVFDEIWRQTFVSTAEPEPVPESTRMPGTLTTVVDRGAATVLFWILALSVPRELARKRIPDRSVDETVLLLIVALRTALSSTDVSARARWSVPPAMPNAPPSCACGLTTLPVIELVRTCAASTSTDTHVPLLNPSGAAPVPFAVTST